MRCGLTSRSTRTPSGGPSLRSGPFRRSPVNSDVRAHVKPRHPQRPAGWRQRRFFWTRLSASELGRMLANTCGVERNSRVPKIAQRFRFVRRRLIQALEARGVHIPAELKATRLPYPFPVARWHRRLSQLAERT